MQVDLRRRVVAEALGSVMLAATVVGSGITAARLSPDNSAVALLGNTLPTGAILMVLILMFGPISGAHFNPVVSLVMTVRGTLAKSDLAPFVLAQIVGCTLGVLVAHMMFDVTVLQLSTTVRTGAGQWVAEFVATFGLLGAILCVARNRPEAIAPAVGLYITAAYWFTASTSFANPAITLARAMTDTFAGIRLVDVIPFILAQLAGAMVAFAVFSWLLSVDHRQQG
jgi:glycerol uptake facilitator-like aquaporin